MVTAARCGFCETCFVLASIATLAHARTVQNEASKTDLSDDRYDTQLPSVIFDNTDTNVETANADQPQFYEYETTDQNKPEKQSSTEGWCVIWYLGAFGSLVCFFLIITCMELFFRMPLYRQSHLTAFIQNLHAENKPYTPESPPPPYHLFAPPDYYETVQKAADDKRKTLDIFVIPVYEASPSTAPPPAFQHV